MTLTSYSYNELNQLQSWSRSGTTTTYEYDPNGNRVAEITGSVTKQLWYDVENRLIGYNTPQPMLANSGSTITSGSAPIVVHDKYFSRGAQIPGSGTVPPEGMPLGNGTVYPPRSGPYPATVHPSWGNDNPAEMYWVSTDNQKISGLEWVGFWGSDVHYLLLEAQRVKETTPRQVQTWMAYKDIMSGTKPTGPVLDFGIPWAYEHVPFDPWDDGAPESEPGVGEPAPGNGTLFTYDYRTRRVRLKTASVDTMFVFSGGVSVKEFENGSATPSVEYVRGSDWGGGVGGILYTLRSGSASFTHYNHRGDVTAKTSVTGSLTYQSTYDAFGTRSAEVGSTPDREKSNTKPEDIPGYANEGFRWRDLNTGVFLTRDPAGFVDGPNLYTYVVQNPWTKFDPEGLKAEVETKEKKREDGTKYRHTQIKLTGKIMFHGQSAKLSSKAKEKVLKRLVAGLQKVYSKTDKPEHELTMTADLKIASTEDDVDKEDHVFHIVDKVNKRIDDIAGEAPLPGRSIVIGKQMLDEKKYKKGFERTSAHELGHALGLRHPKSNDPNNTEVDKNPKWKGFYFDDNNKAALENTNVMRYGRMEATVNSAQIDEIQARADGKRQTSLNSGDNMDLMNSSNEDVQ